VLGNLLLRLLGISSVSCELHGDSVSSLLWALKERTSSLIARRANIGSTLLCSMSDITVTHTIHVPGVDNVVWDGLTRGNSAVDVGLPPNLQLFFPPDHPVVQFITLCDPELSLDTYSQHVDFSTRFVQLLSDPAMSLPHPIPLALD
jgi:hypothetical protein